MTSKSIIHSATIQAAQTVADDVKETVKMTIENNIQGSNSLASYIRTTNRTTKLFAGLIIGGMILAASILPAGASADSPSRPISDIEGFSSIANMESPEVDDWVTLTYQPKLAPSNMEFPEVDDWVTLTYQP